VRGGKCASGENCSSSRRCAFVSLLQPLIASRENAWHYDGSASGAYQDRETNLAYNMFRDYDPAIGRYVQSDPLGLDGSAGPYLYAANSPTSLTDPFGLYDVKPGVPAPSPQLDQLLTCMDKCPGVQPIVVTGTTPVPGEKHQDPGHAGGTSVDIRPPRGIPPDTFFCCAGRCGAGWGINEGSGGNPTPYTTAANYHLQLFPPRRPSPRAPNAIPAGCKPGGCP